MTTTSRRTARTAILIPAVFVGAAFLWVLMSLMVPVMIYGVVFRFPIGIRRYLMFSPVLSRDFRLNLLTLDPEAPQVARLLTHDRDSKVRMYAFRAMLRREDPIEREFVLRGLHDADDMIVRMTLDWISTHRETGYLPEIVSIARRNPGGRKNANSEARRMVGLAYGVDIIDEPEKSCPEVLEKQRDKTRQWFESERQRRLKTSYALGRDIGGLRPAAQDNRQCFFPWWERSGKKLSEHAGF